MVAQLGHVLPAARLFQIAAQNWAFYLCVNVRGSRPRQCIRTWRGGRQKGCERNCDGRHRKERRTLTNNPADELERTLNMLRDELPVMRALGFELARHKTLEFEAIEAAIERCCMKVDARS